MKFPKATRELVMSACPSVCAFVRTNVFRIPTKPFFFTSSWSIDVQRPVIFVIGLILNPFIPQTCFFKKKFLLIGHMLPFQNKPPKLFFWFVQKLFRLQMNVVFFIFHRPHRWAKTHLFLHSKKFDNFL